MRHYLLFLALLFLATACTPVVKSDYYLLERQKRAVTDAVSTQMSIGVAQIEVPEYLLKREIAVLEGVKLHYLSGAKWGVDMQRFLTRRLIATLQQALHDPNVSAYPWQSDVMPKRIVHVQILRFIKQDNTVVLEAAWRIASSQREHAYRFSTTVPCTDDTQAIVTAMNRAFTALEKQIILTLERF